MATAYTPGLKVTAQTVLQKRRRLPIQGEVTVKEGDFVSPDTVVARALLPGNPVSLPLAHALSCPPEDVVEYCKVKVGDEVKKDQVLAEQRGIFGFGRTVVKSPVDGKVELISRVTGQMTLREPPTPVEVHAYIQGRVVEVIPREGVVIETSGAFVQGIFGVGGERQGTVQVAASGPDQVLDAGQLGPQHAGAVVVGGSLVTGAALRKAAEVGVAGIVAGGVVDTDLIAFVGHDIGVAITGQEDVPFTLILTEGFGKIRMAEKTFELLRSLAGRAVSINGATQIRAGVMRPEIIAPHPSEHQRAAEAGEDASTLAVGTPIRIIREPYFGQLAEVVGLPPELVSIETEARVRVLRARLASGVEVTLPRANVEIIAS